VNLTGSFAPHLCLDGSEGPRFLSVGVSSRVLLRPLRSKLSSRHFLRPTSSVPLHSRLHTALNSTESLEIVPLASGYPSSPQPCDAYSCSLASTFSHRWAVVGCGRTFLLSVRSNYQSWFTSSSIPKEPADYGNLD